MTQCRSSRAGTLVLLFAAFISGPAATGLAPSINRRGWIAKVGGASTAMAGGWAARADERSDAIAVLKDQFSVMEDVLEDLSDTQPGLPAWKRKEDPPGTYDAYEKGLQEVALKVNPALETIGDNGDPNLRKAIDAFKVHANSAVLASRRPEAASDRRKTQFELDEMEQAITKFLGRL